MRKIVEKSVSYSIAFTVASLSFSGLVLGVAVLTVAEKLHKLYFDL